jgi:hypothetical protein
MVLWSPARRSRLWEALLASGPAVVGEMASGEGCCQATKVSRIHCSRASVASAVTCEMGSGALAAVDVARAGNFARITLSQAGRYREGPQCPGHPVQPSINHRAGTEISVETLAHASVLSTIYRALAASVWCLTTCAFACLAIASSRPRSLSAAPIARVSAPGPTS